MKFSISNVIWRLVAKRECNFLENLNPVGCERIKCKCNSTMESFCKFISFNSYILYFTWITITYVDQTLHKGLFMGNNHKLEIYSTHAHILQTCNEFDKSELDFPFPSLAPVQACNISNE